MAEGGRKLKHSRKSLFLLIIPKTPCPRYLHTAGHSCPSPLPLAPGAPGRWRPGRNRRHVYKRPKRRDPKQHGAAQPLCSLTLPLPRRAVGEQQGPVHPSLGRRQGQDSPKVLDHLSPRGTGKQRRRQTGGGKPGTGHGFAESIPWGRLGVSRSSRQQPQVPLAPGCLQLFPLPSTQVCSCRCSRYPPPEPGWAPGCCCGASWMSGGQSPCGPCRCAGVSGRRR